MITEKEVKEQAAISDEAALEVSIKHWKELATCTKEEYEETRDDGYVWSEHCGLCSRHNPYSCVSGRSKCPLRIKKGTTCANIHPFMVAKKAEDFDSFRAAAYKMYELLCSLRVKCEKKPELRHGDYGLDDSNTPCLSLYSSTQGGLREMGPACFHDNCGSNATQRPDNKFGNIFDELKELVEPLDVFNEMDLRFSIKQIDGENYLRIMACADDDVITYDIEMEKAKQIPMKILRLIRTAENAKTGSK